MKFKRQNSTLVICLYFAACLSLPLIVPSVVPAVLAQDPRPVSPNSDPDQIPERIDLENGGYKEVYRNSDGIVWKEEEFAGGVLVSTTRILTAYPDGSRARVLIHEIILNRQIHARFDRRGNPIARRVVTNERDFIVNTYEEWSITENAWLPLTRFRQDPETGELFFEKWNNYSGRWMSDPKSGSLSGHKSVTVIKDGLQRMTFETPNGDIVFNVTDDITSGSTVSGSIFVKPKGKDEKERTGNANELGKYALELGDQKFNSPSRVYDPKRIVIPESTSGPVELTLKDKNGKHAVTTMVFVTSAVSVDPIVITTQELGQQGESIKTTGTFDGDSSNTTVSIGGEAVPVIAESETTLIAFNSSSTLGETEISITEHGRVTENKFRNVGIRLSAPKLDLLRGEQTTLTVKVLGLAGIKRAIPLILENKSPTVVTMEGGNLQIISIAPNEVLEGVYSATRRLTGIKRGSFTISGTVDIRTLSGP
ncbi:MAG: hypothetical protein R2681_09000 [Pyrinomonadaceae bacterium]